MIKPALVYSNNYALDLGTHVFPGQKYRLVFEAMKKRGTVEGFLHLEPSPASDDMVSRAHSPEYVDSLRSLKRNHMTEYSEIPLTKAIVEAFFLAAGGTVLAAREALSRGAAANVGGGFHHAGESRAEGFCYINDIAVAIRQLQGEQLIKKAAVIDCDLHQGNGTALIFKDDPSVFTFSIHQEKNYPLKAQSTWDIGLVDSTGDEEYLRKLGHAVPKILDSFAPDLVIYQAGADPYQDDQLGGLSITKNGLEQRDRIVYAHCRHRKIPWAVTLGGGYARDVQDTVEIHRRSIEAIHDYV